jgi:hypothetical protein
MNENNPPANQIPPTDPVSVSAEIAPPAGPVLPPSAALVVNGEIKSERELELERNLAATLAETERLRGELTAAQAVPVAPPPKPPKPRCIFPVFFESATD